MPGALDRPNPMGPQNTGPMSAAGGYMPVDNSIATILETYENAKNFLEDMNASAVRNNLGVGILSFEARGNRFNMTLVAIKVEPEETKPEGDTDVGKTGTGGEGSDTAAPADTTAPMEQGDGA